MKVVVNRKTWLRGEGEDNSGLYRSSDGKMCCLGFAGIVCGYNIDELDDNKTPIGVNDISKWPDNFFEIDEHQSPNYPHAKESSRFVNKAMAVNDDADFTDIEREAKLTQIFIDNGHEIVFEG